VQALIQFFIELCLLRKAPQDLPGSDVLFRLTLAADLVVGVLVGLAAGLSVTTGLLQGGLEIAMMLGALYGALMLTGHPARFQQAATALLGTGALIGIIAVAPLAMNATGTEETDAAALGAVLLLALMVWSVVVTGHILRHTFAITLGQGAAVAVAFELLAIALLGGLFSGA
jgi:hypothetical protein